MHHFYRKRPKEWDNGKAWPSAASRSSPQQSQIMSEFGCKSAVGTMWIEEARVGNLALLLRSNSLKPDLSTRCTSCAAAVRHQQ